MIVFSSVAVLGAGTMGHALALVHALAGCSVRLQDIRPEALERAREPIEAALSTLVEAGEVGEGAAAAARARIVAVSSLEAAVTDAELVIETIVEDREAKRALFADLARLVPAEAVVASNTSYLDVFPLMPEDLQRRAAIAHWYTPPYILDLVDLVPGPATDPALLDRLEAFYRAIGKRPVRFSRMLEGYVANRLQAAMTAEIFRLLDEEGIEPAVIDESIRHGLGLRLLLMGQLEKADYTGLELVAKALANRSYTPPPPRTRSTTLDRLLAEGRTGVLAGRGFFDYGGKPAAALFRERDRKLLTLKRAWRAIAEEGR
ncbi:MAG: 3-hydroxyacyl-CoA dehydrogenase family protein [Geminicoccaceae bacterium]|nr:3-hydroxyacyl-CoA dehydrogenase family protein [Geminicoccaceae bacterium]